MMFKWIAVGAAVGAGFVFAAGCYVGWKTTMMTVTAVKKKMGDAPTPAGA
jgi:hypothetical protein